MLSHYVSLTINNISCRIIALAQLTWSLLLMNDSYLDKIQANKINVLIGGININLLNENDVYVNKYLSVLAKYGFVPYILNPTRITPETESCIDHIFLKKPNNN